MSDSPIKVLIAEDTEPLRRLYKKIINAAPDMGVVADTDTGKDAVALALQTQPDVILMDIRMPVMDGYDATRAIKALEREDKDLPIIAMTADAFSDDAQRCLECGMVAHIAKPIDVKECMRILNKYLGNKNNEGENK